MTTKNPDMVPVSRLRKHVADILERLKDSDEPTVITRRGRPEAVLLSVDAYEEVQHELELLRRLARGEAEIAAGKEHTLQEVLREADEILDIESA